MRGFFCFSCLSKRLSLLSKGFFVQIVFEVGVRVCCLKEHLCLLSKGVSLISEEVSVFIVRGDVCLFL